MARGHEAETTTYVGVNSGGSLRQRPTEIRSPMSSAELMPRKSNAAKGGPKHDTDAKPSSPDAAAALSRPRRPGGSWRFRFPPVAPLSPRALSVLYMSLAISVHMAGYELARNATLAMFTSAETGFESSSALPVAVGFVSPCSLALLWLYARILDKRGPRTALRSTTVLFSAVLVLGGLFLGRVILPGAAGDPSRTDDWSATEGLSHRLRGAVGKGVLFGLFVYQTSSVQLLHTQHWSFVGSVLTPEQGASWFAPVAGLGSVSSTVAAAGVSYLVDYLGLTGLLCSAGFIILLSLVCADAAYNLSFKHGFVPSHKSDHDSNTKETNESPSANDKKVMHKAADLFRRVPTLSALFVEVLFCQCLSSLLSFLFMVKAKDAIQDDKLRAGWTGNCYAWTNAVSGILQFFVLPIVLKHIDPTRLFLFMPSVMVTFTMLQHVHGGSSLFLAGASFFAMKTIEYSFRGAAMEMLYSTLDYESRYVGKEVITLFANRFGKSGMAVAIFLLTSIWNDSDLESYLSQMSSVVACFWLYSSCRLVSTINQRGKS